MSIFNKKKDSQARKLTVTLRKHPLEYVKSVAILFFIGFGLLTMFQARQQAELTMSDWIFTDMDLTKVNPQDVDKSAAMIGFIDLSGPIVSKEISGTTMAKRDFITPSKTREYINDLKKRDDLKGIVLKIDSPGGTVTASDEISRIVHLANKELPIYVYTNTVLASGGYYLSAPASKIFASPQSQVGSIGVIYQMINYETLAKERLGIEITTFKKGQYKDLGNPLRTISKDEEAVIQAKVDEAYQAFKKVIMDNRGIEQEKFAQIATGLTYSGSSAHNNGLIDDVFYIDELPKKIKEIIGSEKLYLVQKKSHTRSNGILTRLLVMGESFWGPIQNIAKNINITPGLHYLAPEFSAF